MNQIIVLLESIVFYGSLFYLAMFSPMIIKELFHLSGTTTNWNKFKWAISVTLFVHAILTY